ncbi:MAG: CAP domain-containing protein [Pirellulaceae bacterium]
MRLRILYCLLTAVMSATWLPGQIREHADQETTKAEERTAAPDSSLDRQQVAETIVERTNRLRERNGCEPTKVDEQLLETAQYFANFLARTDKYGHHADGNSPAQRAANHGYDYCLVAENIAYQYDSTGFTVEQLARGFYRGWKQSPEHRENMLDPAVRETAVAIARSDSTGYYYGVQMFGRPRSDAIRFTISNRSGTTVSYRLGDRDFELPPRYSRTHEQCRAAELAMPAADESEEPEVVQPQDGDRFVVVDEADGPRLQRAQPAAAAESRDSSQPL